MTVFHYPGNLRVGVRNETVHSEAPSARMIDQDRMLLMLILNGHQRFTYEGESFAFSTLQPQDPGPKAVFLNFKAGQKIAYVESDGTPLIKISVSFDEQWLAQAGTLIEEPTSPDLRHIEVAALPEAMTRKVWSPDAEMTAIASEITRYNEEFQAGLLSRNALNLALMSRGVDLLRAALVQIGTLHETAHPHDSHAHSDPRLERLTAYVASHIERADWGPEDMARACGISMRSLQRLCHTELGCSPSAFIRNQRMQAVFTALSLRRISLQQAAYLAGYSNTGNFSTAFKRMFGITPASCK